MGLFSYLPLCFSSLRIFALVVLLLSIAQLLAFSSVALASNELRGALTPQTSRSSSTLEWPSYVNNQNNDFVPLMIRNTRRRIERRDRPCLINAGLSQGCDLSDILYAKYQVCVCKGYYIKEHDTVFILIIHPGEQILELCWTWTIN